MRVEEPGATFAEPEQFRGWMQASFDAFPDIEHFVDRLDARENGAAADLRASYPPAWACASAVSGGRLEAVSSGGSSISQTTKSEETAMIVIHFKVRCQPEKTEQVMAAFEEVIAPSRAVDGVISFDIARDLADPDAFIATEVFEDQAARDRQESLPEVGKVLAILPDSIVAPPEATAFHVSSSEPAMA